MVVVDRDGVGWLRVGKIRPVVGMPPFFGLQYGHRVHLVPGVGEN